MTTLTIKSPWVQSPTTNAVDELTATLARLQIFIGKSNITEHKAPRGAPKAALQIPVYYFAEWIAENWWVLLFEPRKDEQSDDSEYFARHSIIAAQHGIPLPHLSIEPFGRSFHLNSSRRAAPFSNISFTNGGYADASRDEIEGALSAFLENTVKRLKDCGLENSALSQTWNELKSLAPDEREFCELAGSLGVAPVDVSDALSEALTIIHETLGARATRDFCLAATKDTVETSVANAKAVKKYLEEASSKPLTKLLAVALPPENYHAPSWRRGMQAARNVREKFGIDTKDFLGADKFFERLEIDTSHRAQFGNDPNVGVPFSGAIDRNEGAATVALLQPEEQQRRFSAGRAAYLAWVSEPKSCRLVTNAVTRDQQASRSFAAEILIPQGYLKWLAGSKGELHYDQLREVARARRVMPDVASKQAHNAGIRVGAV